jgi:hypothetical protein
LLAQAQRQAFTWICQQVQTQATFLAYIDVFWAPMLISAAYRRKFALSQNSKNLQAGSNPSKEDLDPSWDRHGIG